MTVEIGQDTVDDSTFFLDLIEKRRQLINALEANKGDINLNIFEDFYPDRAHFIYELLQNAEDAGATRVAFTLRHDGFVCEHDGRAFTQADVAAITGIHNSTKDKTQERIGKFGVGFKSVFVYTQSPTVCSGKFSFRIIKKILPQPFQPERAIGTGTRFELPFDNPVKPPAEAFSEIAAGLNDLDETTLLFLSNLEAISWQIGDSGPGEVLRHRHSDSHFEILKQDASRATSSSHFLKFDEAVPGYGTHRVAVAFPLDYLPGVREFDAGKPLVEQLKIVPPSQGRVAVFFVAAKETSGLLFHIHGPFVPELSRASIKETPTNEPLFDQLAKLSAQSLHKIRDLGLLTPEFLAILPNPEDQIPPRYRPIRSAIIEEMRASPLTPTHDRNHAAAKRLIQARASLKNLLSSDDIAFLVKHEAEPPLWAVGVTQKNSRIDNFLSGLKIKEWGVDELVKNIGSKTRDAWRSVADGGLVNGPDEKFMRWLVQKPPDWLQRLYSILNDEIAQSAIKHKLGASRVVRLRGGTFSMAASCFFTSDHAEGSVSTVDPLVYSSGKTKAQQENAKKFLSNLGVRELGEAEQIELILKTRYTHEAEVPDKTIYLNDLNRFVTFTEQSPNRAKLFIPYYIFLGDDDRWHTPDSIYLDQPYTQTDLSAYYSRLGEGAECAALHASYQDISIEGKRITNFATAVGARVGLRIEEGNCRQNPKWDYLRGVGGDRHTSPIDRDFYVPNLGELLNTPNLELSRLIWRTLATQPAHLNYLRATYQRNQSWGARDAESLLVHELSTAAWVPQSDGRFVRPADASRELLPKGFPFDQGYAWLKAIHFGETVVLQSEQALQKETAAKSLGFADAASAERARRFSDLPSSEQERLLSEIENRSNRALPDRELANPGRRAQNVREQASEAPDKESETRERSVSIGRDEVKAQADTYLRGRYRNMDGEVTCQICKGPLPFKLNDGSEYFEVVEFLPELRKRHPQNYLALCPNHSAMFRLVNGSKETMREAFRALEGNELPVLLSDQDLTVYFSKTHIIEMKAVLEAEDSLPPAADLEGESAT